MDSTRIKWKDRTLENDIKYGGFLSYRHIRIIGWACLIIAQVGLILKLELKLAPETAPIIDVWDKVISVFAGLPVPLFLLANTSTILQKRGDYKSLFIRYGGMAAGMFVLANFLLFHYGFRTLHALDPQTNWYSAGEFFGNLLPLLGKNAYTLNIFIDMLLVVLMFFFMNYEPHVKAFQGKRIILFRLMILLPIAYEAVGFYVKYAVGMYMFSVHAPVLFLLPSKPPLVVMAFLAIVVGLKLSQVAYIKRHGNSKEAFEEHSKTKAHSLKISIGMSVTFVVFGVLDIVLVAVLLFWAMHGVSIENPDVPTETLVVMIEYRLNVFANIGVGESTGLLIAAPLVMLFSYTKTHKNPKIDLFVPIGGIAILVLVILEGCFQVITLNLASFLEKVREAVTNYFGTSDGGEGGGKEPAALFLWIRNLWP